MPSTALYPPAPSPTVAPDVDLPDFDWDAADPARAALVDADLAALRERLQTRHRHTLGFPAGRQSPEVTRRLAPFRAEFLLNNAGDPGARAGDGLWPWHTKPEEREAIDILGDLFCLPAGDRWGYVDSGSTAAIRHALELARDRHPDALVSYPRIAHPCIAKALRTLGMRNSVAVKTGPDEDLDYDDLAELVAQNRDRAVIFVGCVGAPMSEAVHDLARVRAILDEAGVTRDRSWLHADGALAAVPRQLLYVPGEPRFDFRWVDSMNISSKFFASHDPYGVLLTRRSLLAYPDRPPIYTGSSDATAPTSRSGHDALHLHTTLNLFGLDGLRRHAQRCRDLAAYAHRRLLDIGFPATRWPGAFSVVLHGLPPRLAVAHGLATEDGRSHLVFMPGTQPGDITDLVNDLVTSTEWTRS